MALTRLSTSLLADLGLSPVGAAYDILSLPVELQQQIFLQLSAVAHFRCTSVCTAWREAALRALLLRPSAQRALRRVLPQWEMTFDTRVVIRLPGGASCLTRECELVEALDRGSMPDLFRRCDPEGLRAVVSALRDDIERTPLTDEDTVDEDLVWSCTTHEAFSSCDHQWILRGNPEDWASEECPLCPDELDGLNSYQKGSMVCLKDGCPVKGCEMDCGRLNVYRRAIALLIDIYGDCDGDYHESVVCGSTGHRLPSAEAAHRHWYEEEGADMEWEDGIVEREDGIVEAQNAAEEAAANAAAEASEQWWEEGGPELVPELEGVLDSGASDYESDSQGEHDYPED